MLVAVSIWRSMSPVRFAMTCGLSPTSSKLFGTVKGIDAKDVARYLAIDVKEQRQNDE